MANNYSREWDAILELAQTIQQEVATVRDGIAEVRERFAAIEVQIKSHNTQ